MQKKRIVALSLILSIFCLIVLLSASASALQVGDRLDDGIVVSQDESYCGCCHDHNHSGFFGKISCFFCKISKFFKNIFGNAEENPEHKYIFVSERKATCAADGNQVYSCLVCDQIKTITIEKLAHTPEILSGKDATCEQEGITEGSKCSVCKTVLVAQKTIAKLDHAYDGGIVSAHATCEESGLKVYTCSSCGNTMDEILPAIGHAYTSEVAKQATCEESGLRVYICQNDSSHTYDESIPEIGHAYTSEVISEPNCTETGLRSYTCQNDKNHTYTEAIPANGHTASADAAVTCYAYNDAKAGLVSANFICTVCSQNVNVDYNQYDAIISNATSNTFYATVADALKNAVSGDTVVVVKDATLAESATVPAGVMLLVPCDNVMTVYDAKGFNPDGTDRYGKEKLYRTLTITDNAVLTVEGTLLVNAYTSRPEGGSVTGYGISGYYGQIALAGDIDVKNGAVFDCSGYVTDEGGTVTIRSGACMYETYAVQKWRGGTYAKEFSYKRFSLFSDGNSGKGCYPIYETKMNTMSASLRIESGATLSGTTKIYAGDTSNACRFPQIDNSNGIIRLGDGSYILREIDTQNNRDIYSIYGNSTFISSTLTLSAAGQTQTLSTDANDFFIVDGDVTYNFYAGVHTFKESFAFLPGAQLNAYSGAKIVCEAKSGIALLGQKFYELDANCMPTQAYTSGRPDAQLTLYNGSSATAKKTDSQLVGKVFVQSGATVDTGGKMPGASLWIPTQFDPNNNIDVTGEYFLSLDSVAF